MSIKDMKSILLEDAEQVIDFPLIFKGKLNIGEEAYRYLSTASNLKNYIEVLGMGVASGSIAAIGWYTTLGTIGKIALKLGLRSTPIGWIVLAGLGGVGVAYGVKKAFSKAKEETTQEIPKFINTPMDILATNIAQLIIIPVVFTSSSDNNYSIEEKECILKYFIKDWGYNEEFIKNLLDNTIKNQKNISLEVFKNQLKQICNDSKDVKYDVIKTEIINISRSIIESDGKIYQSEVDAYRKLKAILS